MLNMFPEPYEDESLYSLVARYHQRSGNIEVRHTFKDIFGEERVFLSSDFPSKVKPMLNNLIIFGLGDELTFIKKHTPFLYYTNFRDEKFRNRLYAKLLYDRQGFHAETGQMASSVKESTEYKFCAKCLINDFDVKGESYWRVSHQLPSVMYCIKHNEILSVGKVRFRGQDYCQLVLPSLGILEASNKIINSEKINEYDLLNLKKIAVLSYTLLSEEFFFGNNQLGIKYGHLLNEIGYKKNMGYTDLIGLHEDFISYYSESLLKIFHSFPNDDIEHSWLAQISRKHRKSFHPLRHLLFLNFLGVNIGDLNQVKIRNKSVVNLGCLNTFCPEFNGTYVTKNKVDLKQPLREPLMYTCSVCELSYKVKSDFKVIIKDYGRLWKQKILEYIDCENLSYRATAQLMNVDVGTMIKYYKLQTDDIRITVKKIKCNLEADKISWVQLIENNSLLSISELRKMAAPLYARIYRKDKDWLKSSVDTNAKNTVRLPRLDWENRDKDMLLEIKKYVLMNKNKFKNTRLTKTYIARGINKKDLILRHLHKLPQCRAFIECINEDFIELKIKKAYERGEEF